MPRKSFSPKLEPHIKTIINSFAGWRKNMFFGVNWPVKNIISIWNIAKLTLDYQWRGEWVSDWPAVRPDSLKSPKGKHRDDDVMMALQICYKLPEMLLLLLIKRALPGNLKLPLKGFLCFFLVPHQNIVYRIYPFLITITLSFHPGTFERLFIVYMFSV